MQKTKIKPSQIFLEVAGKLEEHHKTEHYVSYCWSIDEVINDYCNDGHSLDLYDEVDEIWELFEPEYYTTPDTHVRIMCLLLASAYAKSIGQ